MDVLWLYLFLSAMERRRFDPTTNHSKFLSGTNLILNFNDVILKSSKVSHCTVARVCLGKCNNSFLVQNKLRIFCPLVRGDPPSASLPGAQNLLLLRVNPRYFVPFSFAPSKVNRWVKTKKLTFWSLCPLILCTLNSRCLLLEESYFLILPARTLF